MLYTYPMKRLQIYIEEDLDDALAVEAARTGTSKAALIRRFVAERLTKRGRARDPLDALVGAFDVEPADVDDIVYGR